MKFFTAATVMAVTSSLSVLSLPATATASASKSGKVGKASKAAKLAHTFLSYGESYSYSMSVSPTPTPTPFPCNISPEERAAQIRELLSTVSDSSLFDDQTTPQARALNWITNEDTIEPVLCPNQSGEGCKMGVRVNTLVQRYILATFYFATQGDKGWDECDAPADFNNPADVDAANAACTKMALPFFGRPDKRVGAMSTDAWLTPVNECQWGGVACWGADTPGLNLCIDQLDFVENGIAGTLIPELGALDSLRVLSLGVNQIGGTIPESIGYLPRLLRLNMYDNLLQGSIPEALYGLQSLTHLFLYNNELTGRISPTIGNLKSLKEIYVGGNLFTGSMPAEIGECTDLVTLDLNDNNLVGTLPEELYSLQSLMAVFLHGNSFSGTISPSIKNLKQLAFLNLSDNIFEGNFPLQIGQLDKLYSAYFTNNVLTGDIELDSDVCANRSNEIPGGNLEFLETDCPPQIVCSCCTNSCEEEPV